MRWFSRGDLDGFFGLALDNLVQLLLIAFFWTKILGFSGEILYGHVLPGVAVSLLVGNLFYAWQAQRLARQTGRTDVCALPYGINTVSLIAYVFLVMLPIKLAGKEGDPQVELLAWRAGMVACLGCGLIELFGALVAERIRKSTPRAALLSTLAGIALGFISLGFFFRSYARPIVGLGTLSIILLTYFGRVRFRGNLPGGMVAVAVGTLLAWIGGYGGQGEPPLALSWRPPIPVFGELWEALHEGHLIAYLSVILPMGLFNLIGSLQNIESAEAAGDSYPTAPSLAVNGLGSVAAALFGSCFPTTIYIGHPGWKAMGARAGYSALNGLFFTVVCLTGSLALLAWAIPIDAGLAIVIWIGIVITAQAFQATPREHAPAVVVGLLPAVAAWGVYMAKAGVRVGARGANLFDADLIDSFRDVADIWMEGGFRLEQGFIFASIVLSALTVALIERRFITAAIWSGTAALLSLTGLMHGYRYVPNDTAINLAFSESPPFLDLTRVPWPWVEGYALMGGCFLLAHFFTVPSGEDGHAPPMDRKETEKMIDIPRDTEKLDGPVS